MSTIIDKISDDIMDLPKSERARLAQLLIKSLDTNEELLKRKEWVNLINKRSRDIAEGKVQCRPIEEIVSSIRRKLDDARLQSS